MTATTSPYVGPRPFEPGEQLYGRSTEAEALCDLITTGRIVVLCSPSGAGKSSLLNTLVRSHLADTGLHVFPAIRLLPGRTSSQRNVFWEGFRIAAVELTKGDPCLGPAGPQLLSSLEETTRNDVKAIESRSPRLFLFVFDQFEEVFSVDDLTSSTAAELEEQRWRFFSELGEAFRAQNRFAVFAMREEYLARLERYAPLVPTEFRRVFRLGFLPIEEARKAIVEPAKTVNVQYDGNTLELLEQELATNRSLVGDELLVRRASVVEPMLLQVTCLRLWNELLKEGRLKPGYTIKTTDLGDVSALVSSALRLYYEAILADVSVDNSIDVGDLRSWFGTQLISAGSRRQTLVLPGSSAGPEASREAVEDLRDAFLIRSDIRSGSTWYELAHDRLVEAVEASNRAWRLKGASQAGSLAVRWHEQGRVDEWLLTGEALQQIERSVTKFEKNDPIVRAYLDSCHVAERAASAGRRRLWYRVLAGSLVLAVLVSWLLYDRRERLLRNLSLSSQNQQKTDETKAQQRSLVAHSKLLEAEEASRVGRDESAARLLLQARCYDRLRYYELSTRPPVLALPGRVLSDRLSRSAFPPSGFFGWDLPLSRKGPNTLAVGGDGRALAIVASDGAGESTLDFWELEAAGDILEFGEGPSIGRESRFRRQSVPIKGMGAAVCVVKADGEPHVLVGTKAGLLEWTKGEAAAKRVVSGPIWALECTATAQGRFILGAGEGQLLLALGSRAPGWATLQSPSPAAGVRAIAVAEGTTRFALLWSDGTVQERDASPGRGGLVVRDEKFSPQGSGDSAETKREYSPVDLAFSQNHNTLVLGGKVMVNGRQEGGFVATQAADRWTIVSTDENVVAVAMADPLLGSPTLGVAFESGRVERWTWEGGQFRQGREGLGLLSDPGVRLSVSRDGRWVAASPGGREAKLWVRSCSARLRMRETQERITALASPRGKPGGTLAVVTPTITQDGDTKTITSGVRVLRVTPPALCEVDDGIRLSVKGWAQVAYLPNGDILSGNSSSELVRHEVTSQPPRSSRLFKERHYWRGVTSISVDHGQGCVATGWADGIVRVGPRAEDPNTALCFHTDPVGCEDPLNRKRHRSSRELNTLAAISPDGKLLVAAVDGRDRRGRPQLRVYRSTVPNGCSFSESDRMDLDWRRQDSGGREITLRDLQFVGASTVVTLWNDGVVRVLPVPQGGSTTLTAIGSQQELQFLGDPRQRMPQVVAVAAAPSALPPNVPRLATAHVDGIVRIWTQTPDSLDWRVDNEMSLSARTGLSENDEVVALAWSSATVVIAATRRDLVALEPPDSSARVLCSRLANQGGLEGRALEDMERLCSNISRQASTLPRVEVQDLCLP